MEGLVGPLEVNTPLVGSLPQPTEVEHGEVGHTRTKEQIAISGRLLLTRRAQIEREEVGQFTDKAETPKAEGALSRTLQTGEIAILQLQRRALW